MRPKKLERLKLLKEHGQVEKFDMIPLSFFIHKHLRDFTCPLPIAVCYSQGEVCDTVEEAHEYFRNNSVACEIYNKASNLIEDKEIYLGCSCAADSENISFQTYLLGENFETFVNMRHFLCWLYRNNLPIKNLKLVEWMKKRDAITELKESFLSLYKLVELWGGFNGSDDRFGKILFGTASVSEGSFLKSERHQTWTTEAQRCVDLYDEAVVAIKQMRLLPSKTPTIEHQYQHYQFTPRRFFKWCDENHFPTPEAITQALVYWENDEEKKLVDEASQMEKKNVLKIEDRIEWVKRTAKHLHTAGRPYVQFLLNHPEASVYLSKPDGDGFYSQSQLRRWMTE